MKTNELRIEHIISAVRAAAADDWVVNIPEKGNDKLSELAKSLNGLFSSMRARIENAERCIDHLVRTNMRMTLIDTAIAGMQ